MKIVQGEKRAKTKDASELKCGEYFTNRYIEGQWHLRTVVMFGKEGWAVTVGDSDTEHGSAVGEVWEERPSVRVTLCDKDGNVEYEDAGEEVRFDSIGLGCAFIFATFQGSEIAQALHTKHDLTRAYCLFAKELTCGILPEKMVIHYPNATLYLSGKGAEDGEY